MDKKTETKNQYTKPTISYNASMSCKSLFGFLKKDKPKEKKKELIIEEIEVATC